MLIVVEMIHHLVGLLVDWVSDIISVPKDLLQPSPEIASDLARNFFRGVMAFDSRMMSIIDNGILMPEEQIAA